jgi:hypothetical protein
MVPNLHRRCSIQFSGILFLWQCALKIQFRTSLCDKGDKLRATQRALQSDYRELNQGRFNESLKHWNSGTLRQHVVNVTVCVCHVRPVLRPTIFVFPLFF